MNMSSFCSSNEGGSSNCPFLRYKGGMPPIHISNPGHGLSKYAKMPGVECVSKKRNPTSNEKKSIIGHANEQNGQYG